MKHVLRTLTVAGLLAASGVSAWATSSATYDFSYRASFEKLINGTSQGSRTYTLTGNVTGVLQADLNTVVVTDFNALSIDGENYPGFGSVGSFSQYQLDESFDDAGVLTLDGSLFNLAASGGALEVNVLEWSNGSLNLIKSRFDKVAYVAPLPLAGVWSMQLAGGQSSGTSTTASSVPEPSTALLLFLGVPAIALSARRKQKL